MSDRILTKFEARMAEKYHIEPQDYDAHFTRKATAPEKYLCPEVQVEWECWQDAVESMEGAHV
jgi:hypothetical protein